MGDRVKFWHQTGNWLQEGECFCPLGFPPLPCLTAHITRALGDSRAMGYLVGGTAQMASLSIAPAQLSVPQF